MGCVLTPAPRQVPIQLAKEPLARAKDYNLLQQPSLLGQSSLIVYQQPKQKMVMPMQILQPIQNSHNMQPTGYKYTVMAPQASNIQQMVVVNDSQQKPSTIIARLGSLSDRPSAGRDNPKDVSLKLFGEEALKENRGAR